MAYGIVSRDVADVVPPDAMADLSRFTRMASNLSMTNRVLSRGMANRVPPDAMADLGRATRVVSSSFLRVHQKIGPPQVVLLQLDGKLLHVKVKTTMDREDIAIITVP